MKKLIYGLSIWGLLLFSALVICELENLIGPEFFVVGARRVVYTTIYSVMAVIGTIAGGVFIFSGLYEMSED